MYIHCSNQAFYVCQPDMRLLAADMQFKLSLLSTRPVTNVTIKLHEKKKYVKCRVYTQDGPSINVQICCHFGLVRTLYMYRISMKSRRIHFTTVQWATFQARSHPNLPHAPPTFTHRSRTSNSQRTRNHRRRVRREPITTQVNSPKRRYIHLKVSLSLGRPINRATLTPPLLNT